MARAVLAVIPTVQKKVKGVEANLIQKRDTAITPIKNLKAVEASPTHMGKTAMAIRAVMENLMDTKKDHPTEGIEAMARVLLNMSCIISTNWV